MLSEEIEYRGYNIRIETDEEPMSPREWDNLGTMLCGHREYNLGDKQMTGKYDSSEEEVACTIDPECYDIIAYWEHEGFDLRGEQHAEQMIRKAIERAFEKAVVLPLYLYDHSGITISTGPFSCVWDSGQVGWIYVTHENIRKEYGWKRLTKKRLKQIEGYLKGEVDVYDDYLTGAVYGYVVEDPDGIDVEDGSCWGFYGHDHEKSGLLEAARSAVDCEVSHKKKQHFKQLSRWVKNRVPLHQREPFPEYLAV